MLLIVYFLLCSSHWPRVIWLVIIYLVKKTSEGSGACKGHTILAYLHIYGQIHQYTPERSINAARSTTPGIASFRKIVGFVQNSPRFSFMFVKDKIKASRKHAITSARGVIADFYLQHEDSLSTLLKYSPSLRRSSYSPS